LKRSASSDRSIALLALAKAATDPANLPDGMTTDPAGGLGVHVMNMTDVFTFPSGCHVAEVEVDPETGAAALVRYTAVDDYGRLINPLLTPMDAEMEEGWEGCLSVPGMRGLVPRYKRLRYQGFDPHGKPIDRVVADFHARVVQHECDHLAGILYPMRIRDLRNFGFNEELFPGQDLKDE